MESSNRRIIIVGLFIFIGILILTGGIFIVGNIRKTFEKRVELVSIFDDISGLQTGNNVWLSGVKIGTVGPLAFSKNSKVKVRIFIEDKAKQYIPIDAKVKITSDGFIGNKILVIYGGSMDSKNVSNGDTLHVEETFSTEQAINTLQESNKNLQIITKNLTAITNKMVSGEGTVGKLLNDDAVYSNVKTATGALANALENTLKLTKTLSDFSAKLNNKGTLANALVNDTVVYSSLRVSMLKLQTIADSASAMVNTLKSDSENPNSSLGVLLKDKESGTNLKETLKNLQTSSKKLDQDLEAIQHNALLKGYFKKQSRVAKRDSTK
jgi:phospholipid/cholesterol/gamma-HCH transport system substrate-binding protein